jgi:hypothetical protein
MIKFRKKINYRKEQKITIRRMRIKKNRLEENKKKFD